MQVNNKAKKDCIAVFLLYNLNYYFAQQSF